MQSTSEGQSDVESEVKPGRRARILVVDDQNINRIILESVLKEHYDVTLASSGEEALRQIEESTLPDLILLDVRMPGLDGFEVCERLRANADTTDLPVIFVTALDDRGNEERGLNLGAMDYLSKPVNPAIVRARVKLHLELFSYRAILGELLEQRDLDLVATRETLAAQMQAVGELDSASRSFLDQMPQAAALKDAQGRYRLLNRRFQSLTGRNEKQVLGRTDQELELWPQARVSAAIRAAEKLVRESGRIVNDERRLSGAKGTARTWRVSSFPIRNVEDGSTSVASVYTDVTASSERLRRLSDYAKLSCDWVWEMDANFRFVRLPEGEPRSLDPAFAERLGFGRNDSPQSAPPTQWAKVWENLQAHRTFRNVEVSVPIPEGESLRLWVSGVPTFDADEVFSGYRGVILDTTSS